MYPRRITSILLLVLLASAATAQSGTDFSFPSATRASLGGDHVAHAEGFQTLFANPAGLTDLEPEFSFTELTVTAAGPVFSLAGVVLQTFGGTDFATLLASESVQALLRSIYARFSLAGPIAFGYVGPGMGFGVFNDTALQIESAGSSSLEARLGERFVLRGGYGIPVPLPESWDSTASVGLGLKGFVRGDSVISTSLLTLPSLVGSLGPDLLTGSPFELVTGIGVDLGLRYSWRETLAAGLTVDNVYAPTGVLGYPTLQSFLDSSATPGTPAYQTLAQEVNVGLAYTPSLGEVDRYVQDVTFLLDYSDILDFWLDPTNAGNIVLKFGLGLEATFLEVLSIRGGFNQGLFAAGLGVDLTVLQLNAAMFGTELSGEPGLRPAYNLVIGLEFRG